MRGDIGSVMSPNPTILRAVLLADTMAGTVGTIDTNGRFVKGSGASNGKACATVKAGKAGEEVPVLFSGIIHVMSEAAGKTGQYCAFGSDGNVSPATGTATIGAIVGYYAENQADINVDVAVYIGGF